MPFAVKFNGRDLWSFTPPRSGIEFKGTQRLTRALAARWWGWHRLEPFEALPTDEQAFLIAVYLTQMQIEAVVAHAQATAHKPGG